MSLLVANACLFHFATIAMHGMGLGVQLGPPAASQDPSQAVAPCHMDILTSACHAPECPLSCSERRATLSSMYFSHGKQIANLMTPDLWVVGKASCRGFVATSVHFGKHFRSTL